MFAEDQRQAMKPWSEEYVALREEVSTDYDPGPATRPAPRGPWTMPTELTPEWAGAGTAAGSEWTRKSVPARSAIDYAVGEEPWRHRRDSREDVVDLTVPATRIGVREVVQAPDTDIPSPPSPTTWTGKTVVVVLNGELCTCITARELANALGVGLDAFKAWQRRGLFPRALLETESGSVAGRRALFTIAQAEGAVRIASEEGIRTSNSKRKSLAATHFSDRVYTLFAQLGVTGR